MQSSHNTEAEEKSSSKIEFVRSFDFLKEEGPLMKDIATMNVDCVTFPIDEIPRILILYNCKKKGEEDNLFGRFSCHDLESEKITFQRDMESSYVLDFASLVKKNTVVIHFIKMKLLEDDDFEMETSMWDVLKMNSSLGNELFVHLKRIKFDEYFDIPFVTGSFLSCGDIDLVAATVKAKSWKFTEQDDTKQIPLLSFLVTKNLVESFSEGRMSEKKEGKERDDDEMMLRGIENIPTKFIGSMGIWSK